MENENSIIILPDNIKMKDAIKEYSFCSKYYIEHLHWDNRSQLDSFINHRQNMYLLNQEYDTRKALCDKLFNKFKTYDFRWSNQSYTSIATSLFSQIAGFVPKSSYNSSVQKMLDDYYPKALQFCITGDIPEDIINIKVKIIPKQGHQSSKPA